MRTGFGLELKLTGAPSYRRAYQRESFTALEISDGGRQSMRDAVKWSPYIAHCLVNDWTSAVHHHLPIPIHPAVSQIYSIPTGTFSDSLTLALSEVSIFPPPSLSLQATTHELNPAPAVIPRTIRESEKAS